MDWKEVVLKVVLSVDWKVVNKVALSVLGTALTQFSLIYNTNPVAPKMAYLAGVAGAVGGYLLGLFQEKITK